MPQEIAQERKEALQQQFAAEAAEKQRNQAVLELDSQLPIREYLEVLRDQIAPKQKVQKWGPEDGKIAYALVYHSGLKLIDVDSYETITGGLSTKGGVIKPLSTSTTYIVRPRVVRKVLGVQVMDHAGQILIHNSECADGIFYKYNKDINPLTWPWRNLYGTMVYNNYVSCLGKFNATSPEFVQQFTQALTDFYVGLKSGK